MCIRDRKEPAEEDVAAEAGGSSYVVGVYLGEDGDDEENVRYEVSVMGRGALASQNLVELLYPNLVKYVVSFFLDHDVAVPANIKCCSELSMSPELFSALTMITGLLDFGMTRCG